MFGIIVDVAKMTGIPVASAKLGQHGNILGGHVSTETQREGPTWAGIQGKLNPRANSINLVKLKRSRCK